MNASKIIHFDAMEKSCGADRRLSRVGDFSATLVKGWRKITPRNDVSKTKGNPSNHAIR
jgi:hypothetical protein